jgi:hypothetical protein
MNVIIKLPQEIEVEDYHEFSSLQEYFQSLNPKIKVKEVGTNCSYIGIVYVGSLNDPENKELFQKLKEGYAE